MGFPKGFFWGGATAANQFEGGCGPALTDYQTTGTAKTPCYTTYVGKDGEPGKMRGMLDVELPEGAHLAVLPDTYYPNHHAVDFYHHWKEDLTLLHEFGLNMFRMSVGWSRIFPKGIEDEPNREGLAFYRSVFEECHRLGIEPLVTISHYDDPAYFLTECGGWQNRETVEHFVHYATTLFEEFHGLVRYWLTFNEINSTTLMPLFVPNMAEDTYQQLFQKLHYQMVASAKAVQRAHEHYPELKVGCMLCGLKSYALTEDPKDQVKKMESDQLSLWYCGDTMMRGSYPAFAERIRQEHGVKLDCTPEDLDDLKRGTCDFYSFSYYTTMCVTTHQFEQTGMYALGPKNEYLAYTDWGAAEDADGLRIFLNELYSRYQKPLMIVENGLGCADTLEADGSIHDPYRTHYMRAHTQTMKQALADGVNLFGYNPWGIIDLVSASTGEMKKRYGVVYVDLDNEGKGTEKRIRKDSFHWYQRCIASNGKDLD